MKQYKHFFGVDISKKTIDVTLAKELEPTHRQFTNDTQGMNELMKWFTELNLSYENTLFAWRQPGFIVLG